MHPRAAWFALVWKETFQLLNVTVAIVVSMVFLFFVAATLDAMNVSNPFAFFNSYVVATLAPVLVSLAGGVVAVGGERQSQNWQWMTTLPITWQQSFITKSLVTFFLSCTAGSVVFIVVTVLSRLLYAGSMTSSLLPELADSRLLLLIAPIVFLWTMIACVWITEPLVAAVVAAVPTILTNSLITACLGSYGVDVGWNAVGTIVGILPILLLALWSFRKAWWNAGELWGRPWDLIDFRLAKEIDLGWSGWRVPSVSKAIIWEALRPLRLPFALMVVMTTTLGICVLNNESLKDLWLFSMFLFAAVIGFLTISTQQLRGQYKFYADRGLSPKRFLVARTFLPLIALALFGLFPIPIVGWLGGARTFESLDGFSLLAALGCVVTVFFAFQLAALGIRSSVLAFWVGLIFAVSTASIASLLVEGGGYFAMLNIIPLALLTFSLPYFLVTRWMRLDEHNLGRIVIAAVTGVCLLGALCYPPIRIFSLPLVSLPATEGVQSSQTGTVEILKIEIAPDAKQAVDFLLREMPDIALRNDETLEDEGSVGDFAMEKDVAQEAILKQLETLENSLKDDGVDSLLAEKAWLIEESRVDVTNWLLRVIAIGIGKDDPLLVEKAMDQFCRVVNPRNLDFFGVRTVDSLRRFTELLSNTRVVAILTAKPQLGKAIFDRLAKDIPEKKKWLAYCRNNIDAIEGYQSSKESKLRWWEPAAWEAKRWVRCESIEVAALYELGCSDIDNMNALVDSRKSGSGPVLRDSREPDSRWLLYPSDSLGLLSRTLAGNYGRVSNASFVDDSPLHLYSVLLYQASQFAPTNDLK
jgi:hypothetical protein